MATRRGYQPEDERIIEAQLSHLASQTGLNEAQIRNLAEETAIKREGLGIERQKLELGGKEITSKEMQNKLAAAIEVLGLSSKEGIANRGDQTALMSDVLKLPGVNPETAATALAASGHPELYNALQVDKAAKRDAVMNTFIPGLQKARSDAEREAKLKPAIEAQLGPGSYTEALARAFPKEGTQMKTKPETFQGPTTAPAATDQGGGGYAPLFRELLGQSGTTPGTLAAANAGPAPVIRNVEGGRVVGPLAKQIPAGYDFNFNTGELVPQSQEGTINGRPASQAIATLYADRMRSSPEDTRARQAFNTLIANRAPQPEGITDLAAPPGLPSAMGDVTQAQVENVPKPEGVGDVTAPPNFIRKMDALLNAPRELPSNVALSPYGVPELQGRVSTGLFGTPTFIPASQDEAARAAEEARRRAEEEARRRALVVAQQNQ